MPSLLKTAILGLNRWAANEYPKRQDFVDDNDKIEAAMIAKVSNTELSELLQGARNINLVNGGELRWGMVANTFSWSKVMSIYPAGGKLLRGGVAIRSINIAVGTAVLANANDCMYITIPATDAATAVVGVGQFSAITGTDKLIIAIRDSDSCLELLGGGWITYNTLVEAGGKRDAYISRSLVTAANDFLVASGAGVVVKKTLVETQAILGSSIALTGNPTAPTPTVGDNDTSIATTAFVKALGDTKLPIGGKAADSELLDGIDSRGFLRDDYICVSGVNLNSMVTSGRFRVDDVIGYPSLVSSDNDLFLEVYKAESYDWVRQIVRDVRSGATLERCQLGGVWQPWIQDHTWSGRTIYVRADGSDTTGDGSTNTALRAFKTIQKAVDSVPKGLNHDININVADGTFEATPVNIAGYHGAGRLSITGNTTTPANVSIYGFQVLRNSSQIIIVGFTTTRTDWYSIYSTSNLYLYVSKIVSTVATTACGIFGDCGGMLHVASCTMSNKGIGIQAATGCQLTSSSNGGTGNTTGIVASDGGVIAKGGTQPVGTTAEFVSNGGQIR